jgi:phosphomannomutase/phosphoglucomutase
MPPERLGLIFLDSDGSYLARDKTSAIENIYISMRKEVKCSAFGPVNIERVNVSSIGNLTTAPEDAIQYYKSKLSLFVDTSLISSVKLKILVDPGNGTACGLLASILREVGQTVVEINGVPSGKFARAPEPRAHTLKSTALQVREQSCDFGAATDTDADRVLFITSEGDVVMEDIIGAIFATATINRYRGTVQDDTICIVTPINSSSLIEHICSDLNVKLEYCRIGQPDTEEAIKRTGAVFAYEESGKYYFPKDALCCDATLATLKLLEILAERRVTLQDLMEEYPKIHQKKCAIECANTKKKTIERKIEDLLRREARDGMVRDITIDGYKRIYQDRSWLLIRISGTEPLIRVFADTLSSRERAEELAELGVKIVHDAMEAMET